MILFRAYVEGFEVKPKPARADWSSKYIENQQDLAELFETWAIYYGRRFGITFPLPPGVQLSIAYMIDHYRKMDRSNIEKAVEDALVKAGVVTDDSIKELPVAVVAIARDRDAEPWLLVSLISPPSSLIWDKALEVRAEAIEDLTRMEGGKRKR